MCIIKRKCSDVIHESCQRAQGFFICTSSFSGDRYRRCPNGQINLSYSFLQFPNIHQIVFVYCLEVQCLLGKKWLQSRSLFTVLPSAAIVNNWNLTVLGLGIGSGSILKKCNVSHSFGKSLDIRRVRQWSPWISEFPAL